MHPAMKPSVLAWAMAATLGLVVAEVFGGLLGHSVALLNDAVHNLSDVPALGISWLAMRWAQRPADSEKTYGYHRAGTLAAFTNAVLLIVLALWLGYEAIERLRNPVEVVESWMIWTSLAALAVNGGITLALMRGHKDLNLRSILVHNFGDALSNIAIIVGAVVIQLHAFAAGSTRCWAWRSAFWCCIPRSGFCGSPRTFCWRGGRAGRGWKKWRERS